MTVQAISSLLQTSPTNAAAAQAAPKDIGQTDFLTLLITQLQHQDPLNPQDPAEFTSQLTQFSSLEQLIGMKSSLEGLGQNLGDAIVGLQMLQLSSNSTQAVAFIGKSVQYASDRMQVAGGQSGDLTINAPQDLHNVQVTLTDSAGQVVKTFNLANVSEGSHTYSYASLGGLTGLSDGQYTVKVTGLDSTNAAATASPVTSGIVTGIEFQGGVTYAVIDGKRVPLSDIFSVQAAPAAAAA